MNLHAAKIQLTPEDLLEVWEVVDEMNVTQGGSHYYRPATVVDVMVEVVDMVDAVLDTVVVASGKHW